MDRPTHALFRFATAGCLCVLLAAVGGCRSIEVAGFNFPGKDKKKSDDPYAMLEDEQGPLEQLLTFRKKQKQSGRYIPGYHTKGRDEFEHARALYDDGKYDEALKQLKSVAKKFGKYAVREDALFLEGEIDFKRKRYAAAQDVFDGLMTEFPATKYKDDVSRRMFAIAGVWLGFPDVVTTSDIQLASSEAADASKTEFKKQEESSWDLSRNWALIPNLFDRSRPVFDTKGNAIKALKTIWLDNPNSPLADDALMMTASHFLREGKHEYADTYFAILRNQYPKSPHFENAYVLGSHVKLMSYQGPEYDGTRLIEAEQLKDSAIKMFGGSEHVKQLEQGLKKIEEEKARREWSRVEFYLKKNRPDSAAIYAREILIHYPNSQVAAKAREFLRKRREPEPKNSGWNWNLFPKLEKVPEKPDTSGSATLESSDDDGPAGRATLNPNYE